MPKVIKTETTVYEFSELSDKAKEKAREWYRDASAGDNHSGYVIQDALTIAKLMGLEIGDTSQNCIGGYVVKNDEIVWDSNKQTTHTTPNIFWSGFSSQGDGASFSGVYRHTPGALKAVQEHAPEDERLQAIALSLENAGPMVLEITQSGNYYHENTMSFDFPDYYEYDGLKSENVRAVEDSLKDFARWIYRQLEKKYEYQNSKEAVDENIQANEYTFTEDGKLFNG